MICVYVSEPVGQFNEVTLSPVRQIALGELVKLFKRPNTNYLRKTSAAI